MPELNTPPTPPAQPDITTTTTATSSPPSSTTTVQTTLKPGYRTTEFWLTMLANLISALFLTDVLAPGSTAMKIAGVAAIMLSNLGYAVVRSSAKSKAQVSGSTSMLWPVLIGGSLFGAAVANTGCTQAARTAALGAFVDCGKSEIKAQADEVMPAFTANLKNAIDGAGKVDRPTLNSFAAPLKSAGLRCGFAAAVAALLNPPKGKDGAPMSSPFPVDNVDLADAYNGVREGLWGGVELKNAAASQ